MKFEIVYVGVPTKEVQENEEWVKKTYCNWGDHYQARDARENFQRKYECEPPRKINFTSKKIDFVNKPVSIRQIVEILNKKLPETKIIRILELNYRAENYYVRLALDY